jgi:hypothetical protein
MTVWIQKHNGEIEDDYVFAAYIGFANMGRRIYFFEDPKEISYMDGDVVVGTLQSSRYILSSLAIETPNFYIPSELMKFSGRPISLSDVGSVVKQFKSDKQPVFFKPINTKEFPAQILSMLPMITWRDQTLSPDTPCWVSPVVDIVSEWRVFVSDKTIVGCQHYLGDFKIYPDWKIIEECLQSVVWQPKGWTLDFGVTHDGNTILIETNDGYSIGNYGLDSQIYAELLQNRWYELTKFKSLYNGMRRYI